MSRSRRAPGRGAAIARQMGLLVTPDGDGGTGDETELEAELLALVGSPEEAPGKPPVPLEAIEEMAALCMRDPDDEEEEADEELEDEADLLAELREVLGDGVGSAAAPEPPPQVPAVAPEPDGLQSRLVERVGMYQAAAASARQAGDGSRLRRYERGLKTLQNMLEAVQSGKRIDEEDIPPPVALGKGPSPPQPSPVSPQPSLVSPQPSPVSPQPPQILPTCSPEMEPAPCPPPTLPGGAGAEVALRGRQRELKLAALEAKRRGDLEAAARSYRLAKGLDALIEAAAEGRPVEPSSVPPPPKPPPKELPSLEPPEPPRSAPEAKPASPAAATALAAPQDVLAALRQRMERYEAAAAQARSKGDDRKARMHDRIVKQYQSAIRAQGAGRAVDLSELPVPPGFQSLQGAAGPAAEQSLAHVLDAAAKLVSRNEEEEEEEEEEEGGGTKEAKPPAPSPAAAAPSQPKPPNPPGATEPPPRPPAKGTGGRSPAAPPPRGPPAAPARQQLEFLGGRRRRLAQAALRAKRRNDLEGAKLLLRQAKGLDTLIEAARGGLPVDISKVPEAPLDGEEFVLAARRGTALGPEAAARYLELMGRLRQQHELCVSSSRQFALLGNLAETTRWERLAEECRQHGELLRGAHARGLPPPQHRYEKRTVGVLKSFPELSGSDLALSVVRGINLPAPAGLAPGDLDTFVRFEFPFPSAEEAQRDKTNVVRNTDCPEFREHFKLSLNRGHRGLRRVLHHKGIKFEVLHKGGLFKSDRLLGTAQLRLPVLETVCELREILELLDGRRPTGGRLEVSVRLREPLGSPQLETRTERWLVIIPVAPVPKPAPGAAQAKDPNGRGAVEGMDGSPQEFLGPPQSSPSMCWQIEVLQRTVPTLPSLNLLAFDREKLERKMRAYAQAGRPVPPELREQHQELARRGQALRTRLQRGDPPFRQEYLAQLERYLQLYTESARRLGTAGDREAAKEALYKRNLVESELQKFRR